LGDADTVGFLGVVNSAYLLHMKSTAAASALRKNYGNDRGGDASFSALAVLMTYFAFVEARKPHPWNAAETSNL